MGQKAHPYGLRLGYIKPWKGRWFVRKNFSVFLHEDLKIRKFLKEKLFFAGITNIEIERSGGRLRIRIFTARPGVIIGRRGQEIDKIKEGLAKIVKNEIFLEIKEVKNPHTDAQLIAQNMATQLEKRVNFRKTLKKAVQMAMTKGALGIKVLCKGRLGGAEIARDEGYREGKVPLNTFRADIDYAFVEAKTTYGTIGCKVWVYKGDVFVKKQEAEIRKTQQLTDVEKDGDAAIHGAVAGSAKKQPRKAVVAQAQSESPVKEKRDVQISLEVPPDTASAEPIV
ncbi:MAG: 30S ribosomal protein S3 [Candidatus Omnitrophica bacterium]|nr:30S ribosomal protein S3 [Candidatus Omnitrophota bacterium]